MKPNVFIGSSTEGLSVAYALQNNPEGDAEVTVWTQDVFHPSKFILESLTDQLDKADVGIFVFSADDGVKMRGAEHAAVRDNVIFEFGLYVGRLGRERSFIVAPKDQALHLPSDLLGMNYLKYQPIRKDGNLDAALGSPSNKIRTVLQGVELKSEILPPELKLSFTERRDLLGGIQRDILNIFTTADPISFPELQQRFPEISKVELAYRLDHLRLQVFISATDTEPGVDMYNQTFRATESYIRFLGSRYVIMLACDGGRKERAKTKKFDTRF